MSTLKHSLMLRKVFGPENPFIYNTKQQSAVLAASSKLLFHSTNRLDCYPPAGHGHSSSSPPPTTAPAADTNTTSPTAKAPSSLFSSLPAHNKKSMNRFTSMSSSSSSTAAAAVAASIAGVNEYTPTGNTKTQHSRRTGLTNTGSVLNEFQRSIQELDLYLSEVKVFQDEQIIQFLFKSGKMANFTMSSLRNLCSCSECLRNRFQHHMAMKAMPSAAGITNVSKPASIGDRLSVARIRCEPGAQQFEIEWLDDDYRSHISIYHVKHLSIF